MSEMGLRFTLLSPCFNALSISSFSTVNLDQHLSIWLTMQWADGHGWASCALLR